MNEFKLINWNEIYNNPNINNEELERIAVILSQNKDIDFMPYFDLLKCSSKFCWLNFLNILERMPIEECVRGIPFLFQLLQDPNWPTYEKTVQILEKIDRKKLRPYLKKYLEQAYEENDEMWIESIKILEEQIMRE